MDDTININPNEKHIEIIFKQCVCSQMAIKSAAIMFTELCFIDIDIESPETIRVKLRLKPGNKNVLTEIAAEFKNKVLEQQVRCELEKSFGHIREMIVKQAFAPMEQ